MEIRVDRFIAALLRRIGAQPMYCVRDGQVSMKILKSALAALIGSLCCAAATSVAFAASSPAATSSAAQAASAATQGPGDLGALIAAGTLPDLRWPNFTDYRDDVKKFYDSGGNSIAWIQNGRAGPQAVSMILLFQNAASKGLDPDDYDASRWDARLDRLQSSAPKAADTDLAHFDLALTVCAMRYISALHAGRVNPQHFKFGLVVGPARYDLAELLRTQVLPAPDIPTVIAKVEPPYDGYRRAEDALLTYSKMASAGDAPLIPVPQKGVRPGNSFASMPQLVARLRQLGDLPSNADAPADSTVYDGAFVGAVKHFQRRHGLDIDGVLGKGTVTQLNVPLKTRVQQLQLTLERYRWVPPDFPEPPIVVNIPEFRLRTMRRQPAHYLTMRVVVGRAMRTQTPVFANNMRYLIFRPYWLVPPSIQRAELVPKTRRDPDYLADHGFEVVDGSGNVVPSSPATDEVISGLRSGALSIRQLPGPKNALGLVKFMFPNQYNVYMHGTPEQELFARSRRDFSHGCIRVEDPVALAAWVLRDKPEWTVDRIRATMNGDTTVQVNLNKPVPVLILYSTAVVEPDGEVRFFDDIYGYDASLARVLANGYPYPG
ncbi:L,D-transpeptidase family protein [Candidatus Binatus soli]|jgi:murein L,D-transpeptidase YcbB/YkuD|uniref:L,D-transpeptidase family protein n=1 Tax=Candidatus Binatus soli TaxID=1953413 RepID=UPI003D0C2E4D